MSTHLPTRVRRPARPNRPTPPVVCGPATVSRRPSPDTVSVDSCPMCGVDGRSLFVEKDGAAYVRCEACRTVYADRRPGDVRLVERLDALADPPEHLTEARRRAAVTAERWKLDLLETLPLPGHRVLDVGSGSGAFVAAARDAGYAAEGIDLSPRTATAAAVRFGIPVHAGRLDVLDPARARYDAVTLWDTLEHCADPPAVLRQCARLLTPGGYAVVLSPNSEGLSAHLRGGAWWVFGPVDHLVLFSVHALGEALAAAGLRTVILRTRQLAPWYPPETAGDHRAAERIHARVAGDPRVTRLLSRLRLGDWIFAAAGRGAERGEARGGNRVISSEDFRPYR